MNAQDAVRIVGMFLSAYPATNADDGTVDLWVASLNSCAVEEGQQAAVDWIRSQKFFPTIAEFGEMLNQARRRVDLEQSGRAYRDRGPIASFEDGCNAAKAGYLAQCRMDGRVPNPRILDGFERGLVGNVKIDDPSTR